MIFDFTSLRHFSLFSEFFVFSDFCILTIFAIFDIAIIFHIFFSGTIVANVCKERLRAKKFTGKEHFRFLSRMEKISSCIVKICAYWPNYFWITKRCTLMWSLSSFISFVKWINRERISLDISQKKKNHQKVIFFSNFTISRFFLSSYFFRIFQF